MNSKRQKQALQTAGKLEAAQANLPQCEMQDDRYPGSFFRVPGIPAPGKTTWSLAK
ncbi:hypothetical protein [Methylomonas rivi]|uniref:Uncharacterized protein n=1 Tax=Methylomonas rivi TaxID=2952226 RepID=A0ABT1U8I8_9GAMM|nr:hypothetical protein [Methylomonas sp. WSC-6]MBS4050880.1 hypothetical protein [Methylomonas sp.]MCQ8130169.1 hypothetical protein [Methylomonas sp. WSC-6]